MTNQSVSKQLTNVLDLVYVNLPGLPRLLTIFFGTLVTRTLLHRSKIYHTVSSYRSL